MAPERRGNVHGDDNEAADEFDDSSAAVTKPRDLPKDVKQRLKHQGAVRKFLDKRMPPPDDDS